MLEYAWLAVFFPAIAFAVILLSGRKKPGIAAPMAITAIAVAVIVSGIALYDVMNGEIYESSITWFTLPDGTPVELGFFMDGLSSLMLFIVASISFLVYIFSLEYMKPPGHGGMRIHSLQELPRYYAELCLFSAGMMFLVISNNYLGIFIGFEMVGVGSYLLIQYWHYKPEAVSASKKAFVVTRAADILFLIGILLIFISFGTFDYDMVHEDLGTKSAALITLIALLVFAGAIGKSAMFPLHTWLIDAMEGPTTVSSLIHAATMVAAGVYLIARVYPLFLASAAALLVVALIGGFTALIAATMGVVAKDIKRIIAYSTMSQYGYMALALGVGGIGYTAGVFHLMNHAYFKALLFLSAGSVIHALHTQNIFEMGGLSKKMKITAIAAIIASLALAGIPPFSGFFSKDEILHAAYEFSHGAGAGIIEFLPFLMGMITVLLTAFYSFRLIFIVFFGKVRDKKKHEHAHENTSPITVPLIILSIITCFLGLLGWYNGWFAHFIPPFVEVEHVSLLNPVAITSLALAAAGIILAYITYQKELINSEAITRKFLPVHKLLENRYYLDYLQDVKFANLCLWLAKINDKFDRYIVDGFVTLISITFIATAKFLRLFQTGNTQTYLTWLVFGASVLIVIIMFIKI